MRGTSLVLICLGFLAACGEVHQTFIDAADDHTDSAVDIDAPPIDAVPMVTLTVLKAGTGTVTSNPAGIACGATCTFQFPVNTQVMLIATPGGGGATFSNWSGGCSGTATTCTITLTADTTVNAAFGQAYAVSGTVQGAPAGTNIAATSSTPGAACAGNSCTVPATGAVVLTAPSVANYYFVGWSGDAGCSGTNPILTIANVNADVACVGTYQITYVVTVNVAGGPPGTTITPTSPTLGATCSPGSCRVPSGGSVSATRATPTDWFFNGWTGAVVSMSTTVSVSNVVANQTMTANYINTQTVACNNAPPANATTSSTPTVTITYTTAGGWSAPAQCPWTCNVDYCRVTAGNACTIEYLDAISFTTNNASKWWGGDDRAGSTRSVGTGQGVTPSSTITMRRFGFLASNGFTFSSVGGFGTANNTLQLDRRDINGNIQASYTTVLAPTFPGGWVYWTTPATTLTAGTTYIFTSWLTTAFTQKVNSGSNGDSGATYAGGSGYNATVTTGDLIPWSVWGTHPWDFDFRVQTRTTQCP